MEREAENSESNVDFFGNFRSKKEIEKVIENGRNNNAVAPYADYYKMDHPKRGIALIFNHVNFSIPECSRREGSDKDRDALVEVFHELDFDVLSYDDLTVREINDVVFKVSEMDHSDSDCLVIVVMSHGDDGKIYAKDKDYPTKKLWNSFNARRCPSLAGKPKLLFIQACRGTGLHSGHVMTYQQVEEDSISVDETTVYTIPIMADILVMYSTIEGYYSWRDPQNGGYFIQSLVKQLRLHYKTKDLLSILTFVNREVAIDFSSSDPKNPQFCKKKQMCSIVSMLTRFVYFTKKEANN